MSRKHCDSCDGCGYVDSIDHRPWSDLVGNDLEQDAYDTGEKTALRRKCKKCKGIGRYNPDAEDDPII